MMDNCIRKMGSPYHGALDDLKNFEDKSLIMKKEVGEEMNWLKN